MSRDSLKPLDDDERRLAALTAQVIAMAQEIGLPDAPDKLVTPLAIQFLARAYLELLAEVGQLHQAGGDLIKKLAAPIQALVDQVARVAIERALREVARQQGAYVNTMPDARRRTFPCAHCGSVPGDNGVSGCPACVNLRAIAAPAKLSGAELLAIYCRVMGDVEAAFTAESFVVRLWDGSDGCWSDCTGEIGRDEALQYWAEKTDGGAHHVAYAEMDYFRIFPGETRMTWDGSEGREAHR